MLEFACVGRSVKDRKCERNEALNSQLRSGGMSLCSRALVPGVSFTYA